MACKYKNSATRGRKKQGAGVPTDGLIVSKFIVVLIEGLSLPNAVGKDWLLQMQQKCQGT